MSALAPLKVAQGIKGTAALLVDHTEAIFDLFLGAVTHQVQGVVDGFTDGIGNIR